MAPLETIIKTALFLSVVLIVDAVESGEDEKNTIATTDVADATFGPGAFPSIELEDFGKESVCFTLLHHYRLGNRCLQDNLEILRRYTKIRDKCYAVLSNLDCYEKMQFQCNNGIYMMGLLHENQLILNEPGASTEEYCIRAQTQLFEIIDEKSTECTTMYEKIVDCNRYHLDTIVGAASERTQVNTVFQFSPALTRNSICKIFHRTVKEKMLECYKLAENNKCFVRNNKDKPTAIIETIDQFCSDDCINYEVNLIKLKQCPFGLNEEVSAMLILLSEKELPDYLKKHNKKGFDCKPIEAYIKETGDCINKNVEKCEVLKKMLKKTGQYVSFTSVDNPVPLLRRAIQRCKIELPFDFYSGSSKETAFAVHLLLLATGMVHQLTRNVLF